MCDDRGRLLFERSGRFDLVDQLLKMLVRISRRDRVVKSARLLIESHLFAQQKTNAWAQSSELFVEKFVAQALDLFLGGRELR